MATSISSGEGRAAAAGGEGRKAELEGGLAEPKARVGSRDAQSLCSDQTSGCYSTTLTRRLDVSRGHALESWMSGFKTDSPPSKAH